ncbi:DUF6248 family natural product biosynthesis protein [Actinoplanes sp. URMC 104]|uniref:DUF6248 family natural product biosynthesis protein n=1 Tax=Actinoplanes sp. URMC 104 TaxID=3423409 RepID=UPI003F1D81FF
MRSTVAWPMPAAAADWIAEVVLTPAQREGWFRSCPCEGGVCDHCKLFDHRSPCTVVAFGGAIREHPAGWICLSDGAGRDPFWLTGQNCRWICACTSCPVLPEPPPASAPTAVQTSIFGELIGDSDG